MDQKIINLFDEYTHKPLTREVFLKKLSTLTGSMAAAVALLPMLEVNYANAATIAIQDDRLITESISYKSQGPPMKAYVAKPKDNKKYAGVVVIHENRGLNAHIEDITRRLALEGFIAMAPDALSSTGGTPTDPDQARELIGKVDPLMNLNNFIHAFDYLRHRQDWAGKLGCIGFCWGGAMTNQMAVNVADLNAAVSFYGRQPEAVDVPKIKAAVQLHYGGLDERINAGIPAYEEALKKAGTKYELYVYEGAQHAFHNDTAPTRYNEVAAKLAWSRSIEFLKQKLS